MNRIKCIDNFLVIVDLLNEMPELEKIKKKDLEDVATLFNKVDNNPDFEKINRIKCIYLVIKDKPYYHKLIAKIEHLYEIELSHLLEKTIYFHEDGLFETCKESFDKTPEYSILLADMYIRQMNELLKEYKNNKQISLPRVLFANYQMIQKDLLKASIVLPISNVVLTYQNAYQKQRDAKMHNILENDLETYKSKLTEIKNKIIEINSIINKLPFLDKIIIFYPQEYNFYLNYSDLTNLYVSDYEDTNDLEEKCRRIYREYNYFLHVLKIFEDFYQKVIMNNITKQELILLAIKKDLSINSEEELSTYIFNLFKNRYNDFTSEELISYVFRDQNEKELKANTNKIKALEVI